MRSHPHQAPAFRPLSRLASGLLCALAVVLLTPSATWADAGLRCRDLSFEVTLSPSDDTPYNVAGTLCSRGGIKRQTIQIALHGATYDRLYWDWPFRPEIYSYVRRATAAGYAVLNLDRIGAGESDRPPAAAVTIESNAYVLHQIVQELRSGERVVPPFGRIQARRVALVGHSLGSLVAIQEAATYGDVDGLVLTGVSHTVTPALNEVRFYPASLDPRFAGETLPDGYFTTEPGTRGIFYHLPSADPRVVAVDEANKETVTIAELETAVPSLALSSGVRVPVLVMVGDFDRAFCADPRCSVSGSLADEHDFFTPEACLETAVIAKAGHDLNLHINAPRAYNTILRWMNRRVGSYVRTPPPSPCAP